MSDLTVTIVVNNFNYVRYLPGAIDTALDQTYAAVQVVVVDDGSTDGSVGVVESYADRVVPVLKKNGGQGSAFNAGFGASTGDIVMFLDADDLLEPHAAESVVEMFRTHSDTAMAMFRLRLIDADGEPTGALRPRRPGVMPNGDMREHVVRYRCFHWQPTSGLAFSRRALEAILPLPEQAYRISADAYLAALAPLVGPIRSTNAVCGSYRIHGASSYTDAPVDAAYFRDHISRIRTTHQYAVALAGRRGIEMPADPTKASDAAFIGFRLASLCLEPAAHPLPTDRRRGLAAKGVSAAIRNPALTPPNRLQRAAWFLAVGLAPRTLAAEVACRYAPDTPYRRRRILARTREG